MAIKAYIVTSKEGLNIETTTYAFGSRIYLSDAEAKYFLGSELIALDPNLPVEPSTDPNSPLPVTETNTKLELQVSGTSRDVTIENFINLFPRLIPEKGEQGIQGETGPQGIQGETGVVSTEAVYIALQPIEKRTAQLEASQRNKFITRATFNEFSLLTLASDTTYAVPDSDTGTHAGIASESGYVAATGQVPNAGQFAAFGTPLVLRRVAETGTAAVPGLTSNISRLNRSIQNLRPGENLESWVNSSLHGDVAPLITLTGAFSESLGLDGKSLRIATGSTIGIGPRRHTPLTPGATHEFMAILRRVTDNASIPALNIRLRVYSSDNTYLGASPDSLALIFNLTAAEGLKTFSLRVTTEQIKAVFPTAATIRPYIVRAAAGGDFELSNVTHRLVDLASIKAASDLTDIQNTRYWSRPGELIGAWTSDIALSAAAASALVPVGAFSLNTNTAGGKCLRITGNGSAGTMGVIRIENTNLNEISFTYASSIDDPVAENNNLKLFVRALSNHGNDLGAVQLPSSSVLNADGVKTQVVRLTRIANTGTVNLPASTRYLRPYVVATGTTGSFDIFSVEHRVVNGSSLVEGDKVSTIPQDQLFTTISSDRKINSLITFADLLAAMQGDTMARTYPQEILDITVTNESSIALRADDLRRGLIEVQGIGEGELGVKFGNGKAAFGESGTWLQDSGQWINHNGGTKAMSLVARRSADQPPTTAFTMKVNIRVDRTVDELPGAPTKADLVFTRWVDPADPRYTAVIRTEVNDLFATGDNLFVKAWHMLGSTKNNTRVNLADPTGLLFNWQEGTSGTPITFLPYKHAIGNGVDQNIDTLLLPGAMGMTDVSHTLAARVNSTTAIGGINPMIASGNYQVQPNRATGEHGFQTGTGTDRVTVPGSNGKWVGLSRNNDATYNAFVDGINVLVKERPTTATTPRSFKYMSGAGVTGSSQFSTLPWAGSFMGLGMTDDVFKRMVDRCKRIDAVCALIAGV